MFRQGSTQSVQAATTLLPKPQFGYQATHALDNISYNYVHEMSQKHAKNKTEVTSVKLVLFKSVMLFETLTKVDQLAEIVTTRAGLRVVFSNV